MTKKIAMFIDVFPPPYTGGAEETTRQESEIFLHLGYEVEVYTLRSWLKQNNPRTRKSGIVIKEFSDFPYHPAYLKKKPIRLFRIFWHLFHFARPTHFFRIYWNLKRFKPHIIYCGNITGWGITPWLVSRILNIPKFQVVHDYGFICFKKTLKSRDESKSNCGGNCVGCRPRRLLTKLLWRAGTVAFVSKRQRDLHIRAGAFKSASRFVIQYPILLDLPKIKNNQRKYDYGYIGRISPEKGLENLLRVFQSKGKILHIAGTGDLKYIQKLKDLSPHAKFHGYMDKWEFLKEVKLLVVPSIWEEPAGRIVREGIGSGCTVAVSKFGGLQEMGDVPGARVVVFDPLSHESISKIFNGSLNLESQEIPTDYEKFLKKDSDFLMSMINSTLNG